MAFRVAAGVATLTDLIARQLEGDLGTRRFGSGIVLIDVRNNQVAALRFPPADLVGLPHETVEVRLPHGHNHDDARTAD